MDTNTEHSPRIVILAGPNGAGKSTVAPLLLQGPLAVDEFVNADTIARGLSGYSEQDAALQAGRIMLHRLRELADHRVSFAFETTLSGRAYARWLADCRTQGYRIHLIFLWLPTVEIAISRVADRVRRGGHAVPDETIRRRYVAGLQNLMARYLPLADMWRIYDNSPSGGGRLVAACDGNGITTVDSSEMWRQIVEPGL